MKILIFGAKSAVGKELKPFLDEKTIWATSKDCNLINRQEVDSFIRFHSPDTVICLAATVGGIFDNMSRPYDYLYDNIMINSNVIESCRVNNVERLLSMSSTCAWPDIMPEDKYPLTENDIHAGPPTPTNFSYGLAKRILMVQTEVCNKQYGTHYSYISPCNIFSSHSRYDDTGHYLDKLIRRIWEYNTGKIDKIEMNGGSSAKRQFVWAKDLCWVIKRWTELPTHELMVNFAPPENITIKEITKRVVRACDSYKKLPFMCTDAPSYVDVKFLNESMTGQINKEISSAKLLNTPGYEEFKFTPLEDGIRQVYKEVCELWT